MMEIFLKFKGKIMRTRLFILFFFTYASAVGMQLIAQNSDREQTFTTIYDYGSWGKDENGEGTSGFGSVVEHVQPYMKLIQDFIDQNEIKSVVDFGCGDWVLSRQINWHGAIYIGIDVVKHVIEKNQKQFSNATTFFIHEDGLNISLPKADLLICKDVLQHLSNEDVSLLLSQIHKYKYCLITNDIDKDTLTSTNSDILTGSGRTLDLTKPPFNITGEKILTFPCPLVGPMDSMKQVLYIHND